MEDIIIVGGVPAGLTSALYLGRACREVLVIDSNQPRNTASQGMHGFISRDACNRASSAKLPASS